MGWGRGHSLGCLEILGARVFLREPQNEEVVPWGASRVGVGGGKGNYFTNWTFCV